MRWSRVEEAFDSDIDLLSKHPNAAQLLPKEIPNAFAKRLALWHRLLRAAFPDVPLYLAKAEEGCTAATHLAEWRNNLVHGWVTAEHGLVKIVNIQRSGRTRTVTVYKSIQPSELTKVSEDIKKLEDEVLAFGINHFVLRTHLLKPSLP